MNKQTAKKQTNCQKTTQQLQISLQEFTKLSDFFFDFFCFVFCFFRTSGESKKKRQQRTKTTPQKIPKFPKKDTKRNRRNKTIQNEHFFLSAPKVIHFCLILN